MASLKFSFTSIVVMVAFASAVIVTTTEGQATRSPLDFWLTFAQSATAELIRTISNAPIPDIFGLNAAIAGMPATTPVPTRVVIIDGRPFVVPITASLPSVVNPPAVTAAPIILPPGAPNVVIPPGVNVNDFLLQLVLNQTVLRPTTAAPVTITAGPVVPTLPPVTPFPCIPPCVQQCTGPTCKPEKVHIVVVDDCDESSESCSSESREHKRKYKRVYKKH
jgi:hypothetical protein